MCCFQLRFLTDERTLTADCLLSHWNSLKKSFNIREECRLTQSDGTATGTLGSNNAYINAAFLLYLLGCTRYTEYNKRCDALVLRLLIKPILATWDISHPSVQCTVAEELHFKNLDFQDKKRQLTVRKLHRPTADNSCLLEHPTPRSD